jgi:hypothetical protein
MAAKPKVTERTFYEPLITLARERYPTANPVPRSLRKQAIRDLRAIERGDYTALDEGPAADRLFEKYRAQSRTLPEGVKTDNIESRIQGSALTMKS